MRYADAQMQMFAPGKDRLKVWKGASKDLKKMKMLVASRWLYAGGVIGMTLGAGILVMKGGLGRP